MTVPLGRHSPHSEPTGELVTDMWETTELHAPSLLDWTPRRLRNQAPRPAPLPLAHGPVARGSSWRGRGFAYWLYQEPASSAAAALGDVRTEAEALATAIDESPHS